jgi:hypothetical protein
MKKMLLTVILMILIVAYIYPQGKILSKDEANKLFGAVLVSKQIPSSELKALTVSSTKIIMFKIMNNDVYILGDNRKVLLPANAMVNEAESFSAYTISIVQELLSKGNEPITFIEKRNDVLTITNGNYTLEYSWICPPFCH